eukprot:jgi/Mesen1/2850/ME000174S02103
MGTSHKQVQLIILSKHDAEIINRGISTAMSSQSDSSEQPNEQLLAVAGCSRDHIWHFLNDLGQKMRLSHNFSECIRGLLILHQLLQRCSKVAESEIRQMVQAPHKSQVVLDLRLIATQGGSSFATCQETQEQSLLVRSYASYLLQRINCSQVINLSAWAIKKAPIREGGSATEQRFDEQYWAQKKDEQLLSEVGALQTLLDKLLGCKTANPALTSFSSVRAALENVLRDSFDLYCSINYSLVELVERLASMPQTQALSALDTYRWAARQAEELAALYRLYGEVGVGRGVQFPSVTIMGESYIRSLENYVTEEGSSNSRSPVRPMTPAQSQAERVLQSQQAARHAAAVQATIKAAADEQFDATADALFSSHLTYAPSSAASPVSSYRASPVLSVDGTAYPYDIRNPLAQVGPSPYSLAQSTPRSQNQEHGRLHSNSYSSQRQPGQHQQDQIPTPPQSHHQHQHQNQSLTLTLLPPKPSKPVSWEAALDSTLTQRVELGPSSWELALVSQPAKDLVSYAPQPTMLGGFDQLLLDSLYEAAEAQRRVYQAAAANSAGRLPSQPGLQGQGNSDPFAASGSFPPPPYVQMALRAQQQMAMLLERRMMTQHAHYSRMMHCASSTAVPSPFSSPQGLSWAQSHPHNLVKNNWNWSGIGVRYGNVLVPY